MSLHILTLKKIKLPKTNDPHQSKIPQNSNRHGFDWSMLADSSAMASSSAAPCLFHRLLALQTSAQAGVKKRCQHTCEVEPRQATQRSMEVIVPSLGAKGHQIHVIINAIGHATLWQSVSMRLRCWGQWGLASSSVFFPFERAPNSTIRLTCDNKVL